MKATLYMAMSADGYIARKNGDEDFLSDEQRQESLKFAKPFWHIIWGRKTYEEVRTRDNVLDDLKNYTIIVLSQQAISFPETNVKVCSSPTEALRLIENLGYSQALLVGGSLINTAFAKAHLLEDIYMTYNPVIIGEGISPFSETVKLDLQLEEIKQLAYDIVQLHYRVKEE